MPIRSDKRQKTYLLICAHNKDSKTQIRAVWSDRRPDKEMLNPWLTKILPVKILIWVQLFKANDVVS